MSQALLLRAGASLHVLFDSSALSLMLYSEPKV